MLQYKVWLAAVPAEQATAEQQGLAVLLRVAMELLNLPVVRVRLELELLAAEAVNPPVQRRLAAVPVVQLAEQAQMALTVLRGNFRIMLE